LNTDKVDVDLRFAYRLLHPRHTVLVTCADKTGKENVITLAWTMPTSIKPPLLVISVRPERYSHRFIEESGEFVVNVPTMEIVEQTLYCGRVSGRECDKFETAPLTPSPARMVRSPIIKECVAHLECKVVQIITTGDHTLFVGEILTAYVNEETFTKAKTFKVRKVKPVFHMGGNSFVTISPTLFKPKITKPKKS